MTVSLPTIGWKEWVRLPELGIYLIKAKIDTGARTSVLNAFQIEEFKEQGQIKVRFAIHPYQRSKQKVILCEAKVIDTRWVTDSSGGRDQRYVIETPIEMGHSRWSIEVNLASRDDLRFRMLLGRTAVRGRFLIDSSVGYTLGKP